LQVAAKALETPDLLDRAEDFGAFYEANYRLLVGTAIQHFHISEIDAESLAHEIFLSYFLKADEVLNSRAWLITAIRYASKQYLRVQERHVPLEEIAGRPDPELARFGDVVVDQLSARKAFSCLTARCQLALRLRYLEEYGIPEVAAELNTSPKYAQKLVSRCLRQARDRCGKKGR
jgi:RNA polymerase sigma factor (sigma-70 family)